MSFLFLIAAIIYHEPNIQPHVRWSQISLITNVQVFPPDNDSDMAMVATNYYIRDHTEKPLQSEEQIPRWWIIPVSIIASAVGFAIGAFAVMRLVPK